MLAALWCTWPKKNQKKTKKTRLRWTTRLILSANSSLLAHSRSAHIPRATFLLYLTLLWIFSSWLAIQPLPKIKVNFKVSPRWYSAICLALFFLFFLSKFDWLAYLGLWLPRHGLEQLVKVWPVALRIPSRLIQWWQPFAVLRVIH